MEALTIALIVGSIIALFLILDYSSPNTDYSHQELTRTIEKNATFKQSFSENSGTLLYAYGFAEYKSVFYIREGCFVEDILYLRILCSPEENVCVIQQNGEYNFIKAGEIISKSE